MVKKAFEVDFSQVTEGGLPDIGEHIAEVASIDKKDGREYPYLEWKFKILKGESKDKHAYVKTSFSPRALFKLRELLIALGFSVPKKAVTVDLTECMHKQCIISVIHTEGNNGKTYTDIDKFKPLDAGVSIEENPLTEEVDEEIKDLSDTVEDMDLSDD